MSSGLAERLTPRQMRSVDDLRKTVPTGSAEFTKGLLKGYTLAVKVMYGDAETFFGTDPEAARITLTMLAIEANLNELS